MSEYHSSYKGWTVYRPEHGFWTARRMHHLEVGAGTLADLRDLCTYTNQLLAERYGLDRF